MCGGECKGCSKINKACLALQLIAEKFSKLDNPEMKNIGACLDEMLKGILEPSEISIFTLFSIIFKF